MAPKNGGLLFVHIKHLQAFTIICVRNMTILGLHLGGPFCRKKGGALITGNPSLREARVDSKIHVTACVYVNTVLRNCPSGKVFKQTFASFRNRENQLGFVCHGFLQHEGSYAAETLTA